MQGTLLANEKNAAALARLCADGRLPHAVLLEGPRGSGRFTFAKEIAAMAVCRRTPPGCGECVDCRLALEGRHPDVEIFAKAGAPGALTVASLRTINQSVATPPVQGARRAVILRDIQDAAQMRTLNTLLKVIEEPPPYLMFILTADSRENILPTILSRCLLLRMALPSPAACAEEAARLVREQGGELPEEAEVLRMAALCGGNVGRCVGLITATPEAEAMRAALDFAFALFEPDAYRALSMLQRYERDRAAARALVSSLQEVFGQIVRAKFCPGGEFERQARRLTAAQGGRVMDILDETAQEGRQNVNLPLALTRLGARLHAVLH